MADLIVGVLAAAGVAAGILAWRKKGGCSFCPCKKGCGKIKGK